MVEPVRETVSVQRQRQDSPPTYLTTAPHRGKSAKEGSTKGSCDWSQAGEERQVRDGEWGPVVNPRTRIPHINEAAALLQVLTKEFEPSIS